jgi:hypothetical protein
VLIQIRIDEWKTAGEIAAAFVAEVVQTVPDPPTGSTIVLLDYPTDYRQVYVFTGGGADIAVRAAYDELGKMVHVVKSREPAIINYFTEADPVAQPLDNYYVVLYQEAELLDKSNTIDEEALETSGVAALIP